MLVAEIAAAPPATQTVAPCSCRLEQNASAIVAPRTVKPPARQIGSTDPAGKAKAKAKRPTLPKPLNDWRTRVPLDWDGRCYTQRIAAVLDVMMELEGDEEDEPNESVKTSTIWRTGANEDRKFGSHYVTAYSAAARVLGYDVEVSRDVALDAMLEFRTEYIDTGRFDASKAKPSTVIFKIALNMALSVRRKLLKEQSIRVYIDLNTVPEREPVVPLFRPSEKFSRAVRKAWADALKTLTEAQRVVMTLHVNKGYSLKKVADVLGIEKHSTVRVRALRARRRLQKYQPLRQLAAKLLSPVGGEF